MKKKNTKVVMGLSLLLVTYLSVSAQVWAAESSIPEEKGLRAASDDLIYDGRVQSSRAADVLATQGVDLSELQPKNNSLWSNVETPVDDQVEIDIGEGETFSYEGAILSNSGLYRFNVTPRNGNRIYTIHLDKSLHTMLLRKNLLRKLGYKESPMKYLKKVVVEFKTLEDRDRFLTKEIPNSTLGAYERWAKVDGKSLRVTLKDIAISEPNEFDYYRASMGIPTKTLNSRSLRALIIPYALLDLYESVNKFSWVEGKVDNKSVILPHFTANEFSTTIDDALWMQRRLAKLTRADFKEIVAKAYFPMEVEALVVEKLISRRNSMNRLFKLSIPDIEFDGKLSIDGKVKKGKLVEKDFPDYASRFAYGDAESPFDQLQYYILAKVQSNVIDNLVGRFNKELTLGSAGDARLKYYQKQFKEGLDHFVKTGEFLPINVGIWASPIVRGQLLFSRDIVIGNYLGANNLVQLADTFGASGAIGVDIGIEGLGHDLALTVSAKTSLVRSYSHLKPVKNLKESLKEPYKNIFVTLIKRSLKEKFVSLSELKDFGSKEGQNSEEATKAKAEQAKKIQELLTEIDQKLDVGESLIITDRLVPSVNVGVNFTNGIIGAGLSVGAGVTVLKRIHLYKKSASVLQIYDDSGFVKNLNLSFQINKFIPILKIDAAFDYGTYKVNSYMVDLNSDVTKNPNLFSNALGVSQVLDNKNFEILAANNPPVKLDVRFKDKSGGLSLLLFKIRTLIGKTYYDVEAKDDVKGSYFSYEKNFLAGISPESFTKQVLNYYLAKEIEDFDIAITDDTSSNKIPGQSFFGRSRTQKMRYEAVLDENKKFDQQFVSFSDIKQGWVMSEKNVKKFMNEVNEKFQTPIFETGKIDFKKLRLYNIGYSVNLYENGIQKINSIPTSEIDDLENKYRSVAACYFNDKDIKTRKCGDLGEVRSQIKKCAKKRGEEDKAVCTTDLFQILMENLEFKDFRQLIGEKNLYIYATLDGFRVNSEILNDTIQSNTIGEIGSKQWNGPISVVRDLLGISSGEFRGTWMREVL